MRDFINRLNGWQRLWAVCASVWVVTMVFDIIYTMWNVSSPNGWQGKDALLALAFIFLPPILVYGIGVTIAWILAGFRN